MDEVQPFVITLPDDPASGQDWYLWAAVLALIALVAFWPAISGTFLWMTTSTSPKTTPCSTRRA